MKTKTRLALTGAILLAALPAAAQQNPEWAKPAAPFKVIGDTYYVGTEGLGSYLVKTSAGLVLIDVGLPENAALVEANIAALGFKLSDVKQLLISHGHYDHAGGLAKLKADTGAVLAAANGERYALEKGVYPGSEAVTRLNYPPVAVDRGLKDGDVVDVGGVKFTAHLTPGHTKGCTTWTWPVKDADGSSHTAVYFCSGSVAANSLKPEQYPGIVADYRSTFAKAKTIQGDVFLAPHAEMFAMAAKRAKLGQSGPNPFIDRAGYEALLNTQQAAFEAALAKATAPKASTP